MRNKDLEMKIAGKVLLHACCAPCATHAIELLQQHCSVTLFYSNSNIFPYDEYCKRFAEMKRLASIYACPLVEDSYDHDEWLAWVRGLEAEPEKGRRCLKCFEFNLGRAGVFARGNGFSGYTTTLTVSPHKRSGDIFEIGRQCGDFLAIDFKKKDGFKSSLELSRKYALYRQHYCGCEFSRPSEA